MQCYRDLPILINQWANVVRWELRPRLFLRTAEFLWQEGHTAHETEAEAMEETMQMLRVYETFARDYLALPVFTGEKTAGERFPGAVHTLCIEAMVQDRKAIQAGTSHFLGQNFAKASGIKFQSREGKQEHAWTTSWGVTTRLIGTLIMAHGDDDGLALPPRVAPAQAVVIPITPKEESRAEVLEAAERIAASLREIRYHGDLINVELDKRDLGGGVKSWDWIKKGVPTRIEIGPRDLAQGMVALSRRDQPHKERSYVSAEELPRHIPSLLDEIQAGMLARATAFRNSHTQIIESEGKFVEFFTPKNPEKPEIHGGFALAYWNGSTQLEEKIKDKLSVTIRCIPLESKPETGRCIFTGQPSSQQAVWAKS